jgi:uncharacterized repeat protein (TIGR02543 family)
MWRLHRSCWNFALIAFLLIIPKNLMAVDYSLTTQTNGSGVVTLNPTNGPYPANSVVTATAVPSGGWYFSGWSGEASGTANPINVAMTNNITITANFLAIPTYLLTIASNGMGSVSLNPPGGSYLSNSVVSATASPVAGWVFANWAGYTNGNANPLAITMNSNEAVTAVFAEPATIVQGPQNAATTSGGTVNFSVQAVGAPALFYQWWGNGSMLGTATNATLTLSNVQLSQEGTYSIVVSNAYGMSSNSALLTITNAPSGTNVVSVATQAALQSAIGVGGIVTFGFNGTITVTSTINITNNVTMDASGRTVVISGNDAVSLFNVSPGVTFSATNLVMVNGSVVGQNGANGGSATPAQNGAPGQGGAIFDNGGTVQLIGCTLASNSVTGGMGGSATEGLYETNAFGGAGQGGAIFVSGGSLQLESVNLFGNSANGGPSVPGGPEATAIVGGNGLGGAIYITNGSVLIVNCNVSSNVCTAPEGGGRDWG